MSGTVNATAELHCECSRFLSVLRVARAGRSLDPVVEEQIQPVIDAVYNLQVVVEKTPAWAFMLRNAGYLTMSLDEMTRAQKASEEVKAGIIH